MNWNKFVDTLEGAIGNKSPENVAKIQGAIQAFFNQPKKDATQQIQAMKKLGVQAFGTSGDMQDLLRGAFDVTVEALNYDMYWQEAFKKVDPGTGRQFWQIYTVESGLQIRLVPEGQRIQIEKISGSRVPVYVDKYGGAIGWTDEMMRFREVAAMMDLAEEFRNKFFTNQADNHYALLAAAAVGNVTAYQGAAADGRLQRDILTINRAMFTLADRCKDKGYGNTATMPFLIYANPNDEARIEAAFTATTQALAAAGRTGDTVRRVVRRFYTFTPTIASGAPLLILPQNKIQRAEVMTPTILTAPQDVLTLNMVQAVWAYYGAAVGDTDQCQTITLS